MIESLIDRLTRASLRFKWVTIALAIVALVAGVIAVTQLKQELIPNIEFPTTIVLALNSGAEPETMRDEVTIPIEEAVKDIDGVVNVESTTTSGHAQGRDRWRYRGTSLPSGHGDAGAPHLRHGRSAGGVWQCLL
jgi:cell division protein FtsX